MGAADTGPLSVDTEGGNDVLAPLAAVPIEPEPANSSVVASRRLAAPTLVPCTNTDTGRIKVQGQNGQKKCKDWEKKGLCTSAMKKYGGTPLFTVCEKSCNHCPAAPTGPTLVPCTDTKKKNQSGRSKRQQEVRLVEEKSKRCM